MHLFFKLKASPSSSKMSLLVRLEPTGVICALVAEFLALPFSLAIFLKWTFAFGFFLSAWPVFVVIVPKSYLPTVMG